MPAGKPEAVFFDFDGTLADTAPDLARALNRVRREDGLPDACPTHLRSQTSNGVRGLLAAGYGITSADARYAGLAQRFLAAYESDLCVDTRLFDGIPELLDALDQHRIPWGIVTNKSSRYTHPIVQQLGLTSRTACIVCGDSSPRAKPAAAPLLLAARITRVTPTACVYLGDDERDIQAAHAAGMDAAVALWGYLGTAVPPQDWGARDLHVDPRAFATSVTAPW